jgi:hypothetical protein
MKSAYQFAAVLLLISILFLPILYPHPAVSAQQSSWSPPVNLSQSGSSSNPVIVIDSNQNVHTIWLDTFNDYGYAFWNGESWSDPIGLTYNFYPEIPTLIAGDNGQVHGFWINDNGVLLYSRVDGTSMGVVSAWTPGLALGTGILNFHASTDAQGRLHLAYAQGPNENGIPTGVYYRQADQLGTSWTTGIAVYLSPYFRSATAEDAHVYVATTQVDNSTRVYLGFDNPALKRVFLAASPDNGVSWGEPLEIDHPDLESVANTPFDLMVYPDQQNILVMWKNTLQSSFDCNQYYQFSTDGGATWSARHTTFDELVGCPQGNMFFAGPDNSVLLMTDIQELAYIQAWNWDAWSDPQVQSGLNQFTDPVTFSDLSLANKRAAMGANFRLYVTGADRVGNQDVWVLYRDVADINTWYPPPQAWQAPETLADSIGKLQDPVLISDNEGLFHLFWSQSADPDNPDNEWRIYYSQYDGNEWLEPVAVLKSPDKFATQISVAVDGNQKIYVTWHGKEAGEIYFAWAEADKAYSVFEWSDPQILPHPAGKAAQPKIYLGLNNSLFVTYSIPINEGRGIYLTKSTDEGETWSEPIMIFDAVAANWDVVGEAHLAQTNDGSFHVLFSQRNREENADAAVFYMNSIDGGSTWSLPTMVIDQPIVAFKILASNQLTLHRYWQTDVSVDASLWHEVSLDSGLTWITSAPITVLGMPGPSDLVLDSLDRLHLLQRFTDSQGSQFLQHWEWRGNSWESQDNLAESPQFTQSASALTAFANTEGRLDVVTLEQQVDRASGVLTNYLLTTSRILDEQILQVTPVAPEPRPTVTPAPDASAATPGTSQESVSTETTPLPTTPTPISFEGMDVISPPTSSITFLIVGVGSALVVMVLLLVFVRLRRR